MKYTRPALTSRQIFALGAVRDAVVKSQYKTVRFNTFWVFAAEGTDITTQVKALRRRRLIKNDWLDAARTHPMPVLTPAGQATLHFLAAAPISNYEVVTSKRLKKGGAGYLLK